MNIYVYSDESGVFDKKHNDYFIFGGIILLGTKEKELWARKYSHIEKTLRKSKGVDADYELKATQISNKEKGKLFRALNNCYKFGVIVNYHTPLRGVVVHLYIYNERAFIPDTSNREFPSVF